MANLNEVCELAFHQVYPTPSDETSIQKEEFIRTGIGEYAYQMLLFYWNQKRMEGYAEVPSYLLTEVEKDVINDEVDISDLKVMRSLPNDFWLQKVGNEKCGCNYVKSTINLTQLLCDDDSLGDEKTFYLVGNKIRFPKGVLSDKVPIIYASSGVDIDGRIEIDDGMASLIRQRLLDIYLGKIAPQDSTNNSNSNN